MRKGVSSAKLQTSVNYVKRANHLCKYQINVALKQNLVEFSPRTEIITNLCSLLLSKISSRDSVKCY